MTQKADSATRRPLLLDLFCGAGGAAMGYYWAGFDVVGVDINPQPRYPFEFHRADAFVYPPEWWGEFDAIHASPPCQAYSALRHLPWLKDRAYPRLLEPTRAMLRRTGLPWVIENVERAPLLRSYGGVVLCGTSFGLPLYRHRKFESNVPLLGPTHERHRETIFAGRGLNARYSQTGGAVGVLPDRPSLGRAAGAGFLSVAGHSTGSTRDRMRKAMGIDWMSRDELTQSIPPAYTEFIGEQLLAMIGAAA